MTMADRILDCFPSGHYGLLGLLRLADIEETDTVPTAAVDQHVQPRLLVNRQFVDQHAATPEKLLMLVMHELHHVLLGHTTLFPLVTPRQNMVFDCVINALIAHMFPEPDYTTFLTDYYDEAQFPECLLRPPPGWVPGAVATLPRGILGLEVAAQTRVAEVYRSLYSRGGASYNEVDELLPRDLEDSALEAVPLLGGHSGERTDGREERPASVLRDLVRETVAHWPPTRSPIRGRSLAELVDETTVTVARHPSNRTILRNLLRQVSPPHPRMGRPPWHVGLDSVRAESPLPARDRRANVLRALGVPSMLYATEVAWPRRVPSGDQVHVYVDVSGSMVGLTSALYGAILDCRLWVHRVVHLFSTGVSDVSCEALGRGVVHSTGGTDIRCVARHMQKHRVRRACILTDGMVGIPTGSTEKTLAGARLGVAYAGASETHALGGVADHVAHMRV